MRAILFFLFIILLCCAFAIYIHIDNKRFEESLPTVPVTQQTPEKRDAALTEDDNDEDISEQPNPQPNRTSTEETDIPSLETEQDIPVSPALTADEEPAWQKEEEIDTVAPTPTSNFPPITASNRDAIRNGLVQKHGEIPEIEQFIDLYQRSKKEEGLVLDEAVLLHELLYFFYPSEANLKGLEEIKAIKESLPIQ